MAPSESASDNPTGNTVVKLFDHVEDTFSQELLYGGFMVEAREGDMLTRRNLHELYQRERELRESDLASFLYARYDEAAGTAIEGVFSLADAVNKALLGVSGGEADLSDEAVTDTQIKEMVDFLFANPGTEDLRESLSAKAERNGQGLWTSPALIVSVFADDEQVLEEHDATGDVRRSKKEIARERFARVAMQASAR